MFGFEMLDVAIGVAFVYLLISLLCSAIVESLESVLKRRATDLERGIGELLRDPALLARFYRHPLINGLYKGEYEPGKRNLPSYIPSRSFSLAIMDLLRSPEGRELTDQAHQAAAVLVEAAGGNSQKARENIEFWFDTAMDRVSGGYKRRVQRVLFITGLLVAVAMNIDTVRILRELMISKAKRQAVVAIASSYAKEPSRTLQDDFAAAGRELDRLGLPLGWPPCAKCNQAKVKIADRCWQACWWRNAGTAGGLSILGWLLAAFAVCLGAPFWFDLLNKFMVVRSTVKPREKSGTEGPKEPQAPPPR
jgi:hypothetical protein